MFSTTEEGKELCEHLRGVVDAGSQIVLLIFALIFDSTRRKRGVMRRLSEQVTLDGQIDTLTMMELRRHPGEVLDLVKLGQAFVITRNGKEVAVLSKLPGDVLAMDVDKKGNASYSSQERK